MQLTNEELDPVLKRLRRAQGQLGAVVRMIEEGRECDEIVTQLAACSKALDRAGFALVATGVQHCLRTDSPDADADLATMERLFLSLA